MWQCRRPRTRKKLQVMMDGVAVPVASCAFEAAELVVAAVDPKPCDRGGYGDGRRDKQRRRGEDFGGEVDQAQAEELEESLVAVEDDGAVEVPFCAPFCVQAVLARRQCQIFPTVLSTNPRDIRHTIAVLYFYGVTSPLDARSDPDYLRQSLLSPKHC